MSESAKPPPLPEDGCEDELVELCPAAPGWRVAFYGPEGVAIKHVACWGHFKFTEAGRTWTKVMPMIETIGELVDAPTHNEINQDGSWIVLEPGVAWSEDMRRRDDSCEWIGADPYAEEVWGISLLLDAAVSLEDVATLGRLVFDPRFGGSESKCAVCGQTLDDEMEHTIGCAYARSLDRLKGSLS